MGQHAIRSGDSRRGAWSSVARFMAFATLITVGLGHPLRGQDIAGTWQGTMQAGKEQRIVVKITKDAAGWQGVVYSLDSYMAFEGRDDPDEPAGRRAALCDCAD